MTHIPERPDAPELPEGHGPYLHTATLLIMVIAFLTSGVAYLETKADNAEAVADRMARVEMLGTVSARNQQSLAWDMRLAASGAIGNWRQMTVPHSIAGSAAGLQAFIVRQRAIAQRADAAIARDAVLRADASTLASEAAFYRHEETAKSYAHQRDAHTSQVARYVTVITDLAIALFLLGLVATLPVQARPYFIGVAGATAVGAVVWSAYISSAGAPGPNRAAIGQYATGRAALDAGQGRLCPGSAANLRTAIDAFSRAVAHRPDYEVAYVARGEARTSLALCTGQTQELANAEVDLDRATREDPHDATAWNDLAVAHWWQGDFREALAAVASAAAIDPEDPAISFNLLEGLAVLPGERVAYREQVTVYVELLHDLGGAAAFELDSTFEDLNGSAGAWFASGPSSLPSVRDGLRHVCTDLVAAMPSLHIQSAGVRCDLLGAWDPVPTFKRVKDGSRNAVDAAASRPGARIVESTPPVRASS
jgi:tetratricopeptide (TPR) repeat protein